MPSALRTGRRLAAVLPLAATAVLALALPASAHVTIDPATTAAGSGDLQLNFRVPCEETTPTTKVEIAFPTDHPIASVLAQPVPGWTAKITNVTLPTPIHTDDGDITQVVSDITWTGGQIQPGQYQAFPVLLGQLPDGVNQIVFKALQTYAGGDVVRWIDLAQPGQPGPDHPAPVLALTAAATTGRSAPVAQAATKSSDGTARTLGIAGLAVGAIGLVAAALAWFQLIRPLGNR